MDGVERFVCNQNFSSPIRSPYGIRALSATSIYLERTEWDAYQNDSCLFLLLFFLFYCLFFLREEGGRAFNISEEELVWSRSISGNSWSGMPLKNKERPVMFWDWGGRYRPRIFHFLGFFFFLNLSTRNVFFLTPHYIISFSVFLFFSADS